MRVGLLGQVRRVWAPRGVTVRQKVEWKREWVYLNLVVNGLTGEIHWTWTSNMKGETIAQVAKQWQERGIEAIVWDRAPGHRSQAVKMVKGIKFIEQPPYSPELNPAERVFEELRRKVEGKVYGSIEEKKAAVERELRQLAANPERVKRLTGWAWIRQALESLPDSFVAFH